MGDVVNFPGFDPNIGELYQEEKEPNLPVENITKGMLEANLNEVYVVGVNHDGELFIASNSPSIPMFIFNFEKAKNWLLR